MSHFNYRKLPPEGGSPRDVASAVNLLIDGKNNAKGSVTLNASSTTTTVTDYRVGEESVITFMPTTFNAADHINSMYVSSRGKYTFTITHDSKIHTDMTFDYVVTG